MFSLIDALIVRPIVNILFVIYNLVGDFGLAIIIFVVIVKLATWPLMRRQLHQTRMMRQIQPELAEIKKRCNGNRQMESLQMMELYKRKNIKPFRSIATVFIQLPIFMALFTAINVTVRPCEVSDTYNAPVASSRCANTKEGKTIKYNVMHSAYPFVAKLDRINEIIEKQQTYLTNYKDNPEEKYEFEPRLFGKLDLSVRGTDFISDLKSEQGFTNHSWNSVVILIFAILSAFAQFFMTRMMDPNRKKGKKKGLRQLMKETAEGKDVSQEEINAMAQQQSTMMMPFMMLFIMISLPGALVFYYLLNNTITIGLNKFMMNRNLEKMDEVADKKIIKELKAHEAVEAEIVKGVEKNIRDAKNESNGHYGNKNKNKDADSGVHITRITASDHKNRRK